MSYQPFALKYRPQNFEEIVGQEHVSRTLRQAVASGRVSHAYLFAGPRGTGKTSTARVLAKALNCEHGPTPEPCGVCAACRAIQAGSFMDVIEIDAASHRGIDDIRELREKVKYGPAEGRVKVYILDEAHQLTNEASNALLKTLEEPPAHSYFVLATTEAHKFLPTIMSRCQRFDFRAIPAGQIVEALRAIAGRESVEIDDGGLWLIAEAAAGAMRDAESIFDQVVAYAEGAIDREVVAQVLGLTRQELLERTLAFVAEGDLGRLFALVDELVREGRDLPQYLKDLTAFAAELLRVQLGAEAPGWSRTAPERAEALHKLAADLGRQRLMGVITSLAMAQERLREGAQEMLTVELVLAKVASPASPPTPLSSQERGSQTAEEAPRAPEQVAAPPAARPVALRQRPAPPPAVPPGQPLTLAVVQELWEQLLPEELKRMKHQPVWAMLQEGAPAEVRGNQVRIVFPKTHEFHCNRAQGAYKKVIEDALGRLLGQEVEVDCCLGELPSTEANPLPETNREEPDVSEAEQKAHPASPDADEEPEPSAQEPKRGTPENRTADQAVDEAVRTTLELFDGSQEVPER